MLRPYRSPSTSHCKRQPHVPECRRHAGSLRRGACGGHEDRKSTRLNSSHSQISYAVFCLKKKKEELEDQYQIDLFPPGSRPPPSSNLQRGLAHRSDAEISAIDDADMSEPVHVV